VWLDGALDSFQTSHGSFTLDGNVLLFSFEENIEAVFISINKFEYGTETWVFTKST
jgi:hypothetical protein